MKRFIIKFILFLISVIAIAFALDYIISSGLRQTEDYRYQSWNDIVESKINADLIVLGNSRALSHFVPTMFDSALHFNSYNLGIGGYPFKFQYVKFDLYIEHNKKPKVIIQNVDFFTLDSVSIIGHEREQVFPFVHDSVMRSNLPNFGFSKFEIYFPLVRYFGYSKVIKNGILEFLHIKHYNTESSIKGFYPEKGEWNPTVLNKLKQIEFNTDSATVKLFEIYLNNCAKNHIQVILVNSPVYYRATQKLKGRERMNNYFHNIAKKYGYTYLDYTNDPMCYDSTNFVVAVHLNKNGANQFSKKLCNDLYLRGLLKVK